MTSFEQIQEQINNETYFIVFGKVFCKFCKKTKKLLREKCIDYKYFDLDEIDISGEIQTKLKHETNMKTIPIIYKDGKCIGGYMELLKSIQ